MTPAAVCEHLRGWIGTPYRHQGRTRTGVDCGGVIETALRELGLLPEGYTAPRAYRRRPSAELHRVTSAYCTPTIHVEPGLLVLIRWPGEQEPSHMAICTGATLIHSYRRRVTEHGYRGIWVDWTHSLWKLPGVSYE